MNRWRILGWSFAAILLLLPLVAMQFTPEVNWTGSDFLFFAMMLAVAGGAYELVVWATRDRVSRALMGLAILGTFLIVWVEAAVGIFD